MRSHIDILSLCAHAHKEIEVCLSTFPMPLEYKFMSTTLSRCVVI